VSERRRLLVANWKMTRTPSAAAVLARAIVALERPVEVDVAIAPSFPALDRVGEALQGTGVSLAAQDVYLEREGAFTGEVSAAMLRDAGVSIVLVGHSERRLLRSEREPDFARKMARLTEEGLAPLYCVGETRAERDAGRTGDVLRTQLGALDRPASPSPTNPCGPSGPASPRRRRWPRRSTHDSARSSQLASAERSPARRGSSTAALSPPPTPRLFSRRPKWTAASSEELPSRRAISRPFSRPLLSRKSHFRYDLRPPGPPRGPEHHRT